MRWFGRGERLYVKNFNDGKTMNFLFRGRLKFYCSQIIYLLIVNEFSFVVEFWLMGYVGGYQTLNEEYVENEYRDFEN